MRNLALYFFLAYAITWLIWLPLYLPSFGVAAVPLLPGQHYWGAFGPALAAIVVQYKTGKMAGLRELWGRITLWNVSVWWYVAVFGGTMLLFVAGSTLAGMIDGQAFTWQGFGTNREFPALNPVGYFLFNLFTFGFGEEIGWRGYALPVLQKRFNAFGATAVLSFFWAAWHIPAFFYRPSYSQMGPGDVAGFVLSMFTGAIVLTWLYNGTRGSVLLVALFHAMIELIFISDNITPQIAAYEGMLFTIAAILVLLLAKPANLSHLPRQQHE